MLLHAEGGNLGECRRFHASDACIECLFAAPVADFHRIAGADGHGVAREDFRLDFKVGGIADFEDGHAGADDGFAFLHHIEHAAGDRGLDFNHVAGGVCGRAFERRSGLGEFVIDDLQCKLGGAQLGGPDRGIRLHAVAVGIGNGAVFFDRAHAIPVCHGDGECGAGGFNGLRGAQARGFDL